ncbi:hypothetical protein HUU40_15715 [candidate division KSB1 bacterium]|nr:hypothetical protein [candidate division KSB1 bacterium]
MTINLANRGLFSPVRMWLSIAGLACQNSLEQGVYARRRQEKKLANAG